jgi:membrane-associated phospholipid phosphatase
VKPGVSSTAETRPVKRGLAWLAFLGPFFFLSYGFANWVSARRDEVGSIVFAWEQRIPFIAWTIVPYWLIDVLYATSLFVFATRQALDTHARRLMTAQFAAVACFLAFPLRFSFERPAVEAPFAHLFNFLESFDQPFNQAPSLHLALLVILWLAYLKVLPGASRSLAHCIFSLIGVSVLTTWQHHFIDVPTGVWLGWFCVWLIPCGVNSPIAEFRVTGDSHRRRIALSYVLGAFVLGAVAITGRGTWLWLLWACASLALVAAIYACGSERWFQKSPDGHLSRAALWLMWPYVVGAWLNSRWWTRASAKNVEVRDGVFLGRVPSARDCRIDPFPAIVDVSAELPCPHEAARYVCVPVLDLTTPTHQQLDDAVAALEGLRSHGRVLVCCALGFSRSALVIAAWLVRTGRATTPAQAVNVLRMARPEVVIGPAYLACLHGWHHRHLG